MSKKRTSAESSGNNDEGQTNEDSDSLFQQGNNAKRVKLASCSYTTLHDLPMELLECILVKAVAMEVKGMKLAQCAWKEKADLVISRLRTVCSQWSSILTTNVFRNEVHKVLDSSAPQTIRLKILQQSLIQFIISKVTTLKDEVFMLTKQDNNQGSIVVYDCNSLGEETDVIVLPGTRPMDTAACSVSNCVYVLGENTTVPCRSILRITKGEEDQFKISPWISDLRLSASTISASPNGSLIIVSQEEQRQPPAVVSIYNANGSLRHEIMWSLDIYGTNNIYSVLQKPSGNLVVVSFNYYLRIVLTEIDMEGSIVRQTQSSCGLFSLVKFADNYSSLLVIDPHSRIDLFDSEFNLMDFTGPQQRLVGINWKSPCAMHYNCERNELLYAYYESKNKGSSVLTIFRFTEG